MTMHEFLRECETVAADPMWVLTDEVVRAALEERDDEEIRRVLLEDYWPPSYWRPPGYIV